MENRWLMIISVLCISISVANAVDFNLTTTTQWDNGTKSNSSNNYEIETYTDNYNINDGWLGLGNMYSDRFTFDHNFSVSNTTKWYTWNDDYGYNVSFESYIANGTYTSKLYGYDASGYADQNLVFQSMLTGDFDVQVDYLEYDKGTCDGSYVGLVFGDTPDWTGSESFGMYRMYDSGSYDNYYAISWVGGVNVFVPTSDTNGTFRITRQGGMVNWYYWDVASSEWYWMTTAYETTDDMYVYLYNTENADANTSVKFDNFKINSGTLVNDTTRETGNWTSGNIAMTVGKKMANTTITFYNPNADTCIDSISWLVGGVSKASYTTDICNYTTTSSNILQQANGEVFYQDGYWMTPPDNAYDNDWDSHAESTTTGQLYLSYDIPTGTTTDSYWHIKDGGTTGGGEQNIYFPSGCLDGLNLQLEVTSSRVRAGKSTYYGVDWACWDRDISSWNYLSSNQQNGITNASYIYEQEVVWDVAKSSVTITTPTTGTFADLISNFTIQMLLKGDLAYSPNIKEVSGNYKIDTNQIGITAYYNGSAVNYRMLNLFTGNWTMADLVNLTPRYNITYLQTSEYTGTSVVNGTYVAQSIKYTTGDKNLSAIGIKIGTYYAQQLLLQKVNITVQLRADNSGQPTGSVLATSTVKWNEYPASMTGRYTPMQVFELNTTSYNLTNNTVYWIVVKPDFWITQGYNHNYFAVEYTNTNVYENGWMAVSSNAGSTWTHYNTTTTYDIVFALMNRDGVSAYNGIITQNGNPKEYKIKNDSHLNTVGTAILTINAGEILSKNVSLAGTGYLLTGGSSFAGGSTIVNGNATDHVTFNATGSRLSYGVLMSDFVYYPTKFKANWMDIKGQYTSGALYTSGVFSTIDVSNSNITNSYDATGGYTLRAMYSERQQQFNNCTFYHKCVTCAYNIYFYTVTDTQLNCVDCKIITTGNYATAIYNGNIYQTWKPDFISTTYAYNGGTAVPLNTSHFANAFQNSYLGLGNIVNPTIVDEDGLPIANATVSISPQFHEWEDELVYTSSFDNSNPLRWDYYASVQMYSAFDRPRTWITNAEGQPEDENGNTVIYMMDSVYYDQNETKIVNYGGSRTDLRQSGYVWKNNGSDYGYILQVSADGYQGQQFVIPSNQSYTGNITLNGVSTGITEGELTIYYIAFFVILGIVFGIYAFHTGNIILGSFSGFMFMVLSMAIAMKPTVFNTMTTPLVVVFSLFGLSYLIIMFLHLNDLFKYRKEKKKNMMED